MMATSVAMQLHRNSHSCATRHLRWMKINSADFAVMELPPPFDRPRQESGYLWLLEQSLLDAPQLKSGVDRALVGRKAS
jgi:hypothetical protein